MKILHPRISFCYFSRHILQASIHHIFIILSLLLFILYLNTYKLGMIELFHWYCSNILLLFLNTYILGMIGLLHWYWPNILLRFLNTYYLGMIGLFHWCWLNILTYSPSLLEYLLPGNDWIITWCWLNILLLFLNTYSLGMIGIFYWYCYCVFPSNTYQLVIFVRQIGSIVLLVS